MTVRVALLSDLHLIAPDDPFREVHPRRAHFARAWPSVKRMCAAVRNAAPDLVISLGDLVDYYSDANRDFAVEMLTLLHAPWQVTPGNHDFEMYRRDSDGAAGPVLPAWECEEEAVRGWAARGVVFGNRVIAAGDTGLFLLNSACSTVPAGTREWLEAALPRHAVRLLLTHTPLDLPAIRRFILSVDPTRNLGKYVQSGAPWVFDACLKGRVPAAFFGHLHFPGTLSVDQTAMHFLGLSVTSVGVHYPGMGRAVLLDLPSLTPQIVFAEPCSTE